LALLLLLLQGLGTSEAQFCESENPFSGGLDCTQILTGSVEEAEAACGVGLAMPGAAGTFTEEGRCPLYTDAGALGGECETTRDDLGGLVVASVLEFDESSPFASCDGLANVCNTFIQGQWKPASACGGGDDNTSEDGENTTPVEGEEEEGEEAVVPVVASSPALPAEVETIADGFEFTEGPLWIPTAGADPELPTSTLLFSDMRRGVIYQWNEESGLEVYANDSFGTNGKALDLAGNLISFRSGTARDVAQGSDQANATVLASDYEGKRFNSPNDGAINPMDGGIFFSDPIWGILSGEEEQEADVHGVYRIDPEGTLSVELGGDVVAMPNGVAISREGGFLYVSDTGGLAIHPNPEHSSDERPPKLTAWALEDGRVIEPPVPIWSREDFSDGMCVNEDGLWTTRSSMGFPSEYGPDGLVLTDTETGKEIGHIEIDGPTNVECHTEEDGVMYVTAANAVHKITLL
jgi:gluconolactonase